MKTLYHGTSSLNLSCIKAIGLAPGHAKGGDAWAHDHHRAMLAALAAGREPSVFLADESENAADFARYAVEEIGGDPIVITFHVPERVFRTFVEDELYYNGDGDIHAWRAVHVDADYLGEVTKVAPRAPDEEILQKLAQLLGELA